MLRREHLEALAETLGGMVVRGTIPGSPSAIAGVRFGDVLLSINGQPTPHLDAYIEARNKGGDILRMTVFRAGRTLEFDVDCRPPPVELDEELVERLRSMRAFGES